MIITDASTLVRDLNNIVNYSTGFIEGVHNGKSKFVNKLGVGVIEMLKQYIDSSARTNPEMLHHVYEWGRTGSPTARLFDLDYVVIGTGLSINSSFRQSTSIQSGSNTPFYDKARIMEYGVPIKIRPKKAEALVFNDGEETVFVKGEVTIDNPGGPEVIGGYERVFNEFFTRFFTQAFLDVSGIKDYLKDNTAFDNGFAKAKTGGRTLGLRVGYNWITNAEVKL